MPAGVAPLSIIPVEPFRVLMPSLWSNWGESWARLSSETNLEKRRLLSAENFQSSQLYHTVNALLTDDLSALNGLIEAYNQASRKALLLPRLRAVYDKYKKMESQYPPILLAQCRAYDVVHLQLFQEIRSALFGINGSRDIRTLDIPGGTETQIMTPKGTEINSFAGIIANMDESIVSKMLNILSKGAAFDRRALLHLADELQPPEMQKAFKEFFETHSVDYLGGFNSYNFKISSPTGLSYVLKVENRLDSRQAAEMHLKNQIRDNTFPPVFACRNSTLLAQNGRLISRNLVLTDFLPGGDLMQHARSPLDDKARISSAFNLYGQMSRILLKIGQSNCIFPDIKNTNWLVDEKNQLQIADMKSFVFSPAPVQAGMPIVYKKNSFDSLITTPSVSPPEFMNEEIGNVEASYSFMLGKNLYQYLTQCSDIYLELTDVSNFNFKLPIFQTTEEGRALKVLIQSMIKMDPAARLPLQKAYDDIESILKKKSSFDAIVKIKDPEMGVLLENLRQFKVSPRDQLMEDFIQAKAVEVLNAPNPEARNNLKKELEATIAVLQKDPYLSKVKEIIQDFRRKAGTFTVGMKAKADRIERAFEKLPLEDRLNFMAKDTAAAHDLRKALASHRHFWKKGTPLTQENAAQSYKDVKAQLQAIKKDAPIEDKKVEDSEETDHHRRRPTGPSK